MSFLKFCLLAGLAIVSSAQAEEMVYLEISNSLNAPFNDQEALGRGILDRKEKKLLRLYCQQRENGKCVQAQYGVSFFDSSAEDTLGNSKAIERTEAVGPVLTIQGTDKIDSAIRAEKLAGWKYPHLNFNLTKKAYSDDGYILGNKDSDERGGMASVLAFEFLIAGGIFIDAIKSLTTWNWITVAIPIAYFGGPSIIDLSVNTGKILLVPFILAERGLVKLLGKSSAKIAGSMTDKKQINWQLRPLKVSHRTFEKVLRIVNPQVEN